MSDSTARRWALPLVLTAFLLSGIAGLSYELAWLRYLTHLFGASTPAVSATVAVFFTGLALGSASGARIFDRASKPLLAYGILEVAIAVAACCVPFVFQLVESWLTHFTLEQGASAVRRLALACVLLIVPATLIGATFPAMAAVLRHLGNPTRSTGLFYGINTLGATLGALLVAFLSMPILGPAKTTWAMASLNVAVAIAMVVLERTHGRGTPSTTPTDEPESRTQQIVVQPDQELGVSVAMTVAAASGLLAIALEVLLTRLLALAFTSSVHVFAMTLAAFLVGIAAGAILVAQYHRGRPPRRVLLWGATTLSMLAVLVSLVLVLYLEDWTMDVLRESGTRSWTVFLLLTATAAVLTLLPATLVIGTVLPMVVGLATARLERASQIAGRLYAVNTVAGVFGSLAATFVVMPALGLSRSLMAISLGYGLLSLLVGLQTRKRMLPVISAALLLLPCALLVAWRTGPEFDESKTVLFHHDDPAGTVTINEHQDGSRGLRVNRLQTLNNTSPASVEMHYTLGHMPLLLHGSPRKVLMIGFATGTTLAAMLEHPDVEADCVELHDSLPKLASYFNPANHDVMANPRAHVIAADGRYFVSREGSSYDVIVGDLFFPRDVGVSALYSKEHFAAIERRLSPGGVAVAWLPIYQLSPAEMAIIIQSYLAAFPDAEGWVGFWPLSAPAIGLVGRKAPGTLSAIDTVKLDHELTRLVRASLDRGFPGRIVPSEVVAQYQVYPPGQMPSRRLLTSELLRKWAGNAPMNTIEHPLVEYSAPRTLFESRGRGRSLIHQQLARIEQLRPLEGTPFRLK
jgi:spermidine synthase